MYKNFVFAICGCWLLQTGYSQSNIESVLQQVEQNNLTLKALAADIRSRQLKLKSANNLPDPNFGAYYLPFGDHSTGDYTEYQISQSFEFPTVYGVRRSLIDQQEVILELDYKLKRLEILFQAKAYCYELVYLNKRLNTETLRLIQGKQVFEQVQELHDKGQVGILELNKANIAWMVEQFTIQKTENDIKNLKIHLTDLNGGVDINYSQVEYDQPLELMELESIWQERLISDPLLIKLKQEESLAQQSLKLSRNKILPNLTAGFNSQGVANERYSGIYAGISIPLWSNRSKVKSAQSQVDYQRSFTSSILSKEKAEFEKIFNNYQNLLSQFREFESRLSGLNSDELLLRAYQLGELSFIEYHMELNFYRQAYDAMLDMEYRLRNARNQLLKHQF